MAHPEPEPRALKAEAECMSETTTNLELSFCFKSRLADLDQRMEALMTRALAQSLPDGNAATEEMHARMKEAQSSWLVYRKADCWHDYVPHQRINSSFRASYNYYCEIVRTYERMDEIRTNYLGERLSYPREDETD